MMKKFFTSVAALSLLAVGSANAGIIADYTSIESTGTNGSEIVAGSVLSGITASNMVTGGGLTANAGSTWNWKGWDTANTSFSSAVAAGDYWSWGFTIDDNIGIDLTTMDFRVDRSKTGPDDFELQAALNGGNAVALQTYDFGDKEKGVNFTGIDLSSFTGLTQGDQVTFTFAAFNSESSGGTFDLESTLTINGNVTPVPVPAAIWLMGSALLGLVGVRKIRKV